jgi:sec-independent protein translocase protein TatC
MIESQEIVKAVHWIGDFRKRIFTMFIVMLVFVGGVYYFTDPILNLISKPIEGLDLFFMTPVEGIMTKIKLALFTGVIVSFPITMIFLISIFGNLVDKKKKRKLYFLIVPISSFLMMSGIYFGYKYILNTTIGFLISAGAGIMEPMIAGSNYVSFVSFLLVGIGLIFQLPLILIALSRIGVVKYGMLAKKRKMAILLSVIVLAVLTPTPDAFTLLSVSLPVILLYEVSIWIIFIFEKLDFRKKQKKSKDN